MLVFNRKEQESIIIGDNIKVMVVEIRGNSVRIGIEAAKSISVDREEVRQRKMLYPVKRPPIAEAATDVES